MGQKEILSNEKQRLENDLEANRQRAHTEMVQLYEEKENIRKDRDKIEKKMKEMGEDRDKLKQRLKKYRARRKMFEAEQKTCKNCGRDYLESENFNWSCRTHQSEFGGEMWWCCGKLGKDAPGCKFSKHESKDDDDDLDEQEKQEKEEAERKIRNQNIRCFCCKEIGHKGKECPRDPNPRTKYSAPREARRIDLLKNTTIQNVRIQGGAALVKALDSKSGYDALKENNVMQEPTLFQDLVKLHTRPAPAEGGGSPRVLSSDAVGADNEDDEDESEEDSDEDEDKESDVDSSEEDDTAAKGKTNKAIQEMEAPMVP
mmetsp:Transcript_38272/g.95852  ORF Transcript_38272/g.95852 Transcript_38272/m.95852 type:complete len:315 (-) Transcript_38272:198-1142(-)